MKLLLAYLLLLLSQGKPLKVSERVEAIPLIKGVQYSLDDKKFMLNGVQFLILEREIYKNNQLDAIQFWHSEGYLEYTSEDLKKDKSIIPSYGLTKTINASIWNDWFLRLGKQTFIIKEFDKVHRAIYYVEKEEIKRICKLTYQ